MAETAWYSISRITSGLRAAIQRRQQSLGRGLPDSGASKETTELGTAATPSPRIPEETRLFTQRYDRRSVILDVRRMLADNPLLAQAAQVFVDTAVSKSFSVTVEPTAARGVMAGTQRKAQRIINRLIKDANLKRKVPSWARKGLTEGDVFIQCVEHGNELINAKAMPAVSMERLSDLRDAFPDPMRAFRQVDISTNETIAEFALWQIQHGRWNLEDGERYGSSQYLQLRSMSKLFLKMLIDMAIRRHTRGPARRFHRVGSPEHPGGDKEINDYIAQNKLDENAEITLDYFGNGLVDVKDLKGDANLDQIKDVEFLLNVLFPRTALAKGLIGFGESVSRDILDEQREFLYTQQDLLIDWLESDVLRPVFDLALLIEGINPDSIIYSIQFEERMSERAKLAKVELYLEMHEAELMTEEQFIQRVAPYVGVKDVKGYIRELQDWKRERAKERTSAQSGDQAQEDPLEISGRAIQKSTLGNRGNVTRFRRRRI